MNGLNQRVIEECLKGHQYSSDEDAGSDSSSNYLSELDDDYYTNTEKPIPIDQVKLNIISPHRYQQWESNQNPWNRRNIYSTFENYTTPSSTLVTCNNKLPDFVNIAEKEIQNVDVNVTRKHQIQLETAVAKINEVAVRPKQKKKKKKKNNGKQDTKPNHSSKHDISIVAEDSTSSDTECWKHLISTFGDGYDPMVKNVVEEDGFCDVKKKKGQRAKQINRQQSQPTPNQFRNNLYNYLLNNEDIISEDDKEETENGEAVKIYLKHLETDMRLKKATSKKNKDKDKKDKKLMNAQEYRGNSILTTKKPIEHVNASSNKKKENSESKVLQKASLTSKKTENTSLSWIVNRKALLKPKAEATEDASLSWIINKKALFKPKAEITEDASLSLVVNKNELFNNIQSTNKKDVKSGVIKMRKKQKYYDDSNLHSWRVDDSPISIVSVIVSILNNFEPKRKRLKRKERKNFTLPIIPQKRIFPIVHNFPRIKNANEGLLTNVFDTLLSEFAKFVLMCSIEMIDEVEIMQTLMFEAMNLFVLNIRRKMFGVSLKFEVYNFGVWLNIKTKGNLKYSTTKLRIICK